MTFLRRREKWNWIGLAVKNIMDMMDLFVSNKYFISIFFFKFRMK